MKVPNRRLLNLTRRELGHLITALEEKIDRMAQNSITESAVHSLSQFGRLKRKLEEERNRTAPKGLNHE